jgi:acetylornithine deacetylase
VFIFLHQQGIACNLDSNGFRALCNATEQVTGAVKPYSICGSLPLVGDMQEAGYDLQLTGYGKSSVYHGDNEYCLLSDMKSATKILSTAMDLLQ